MMNGFEFRKKAQPEVVEEQDPEARVAEITNRIWNMNVEDPDYKQKKLTETEALFLLQQGGDGGKSLVEEEMENGRFFTLNKKILEPLGRAIKRAA
jgi:hypothetical protein